MAGSVEQYSATIAIFCIIGSALSVYSYYLLRIFEEDDEYEPFCDINEHVSCTKVLQSEYGRGFGLIAPYFGNESFFNKPNGLYGLLFYTIVSLLGLSKHWLAVKIQVFLALNSVGISVWLAYILYFVLQHLCVICVALYIVNVVIGILAIVRHQGLRQPKAAPSAPKKKAPARRGRSEKD